MTRQTYSRAHYESDALQEQPRIDEEWTEIRQLLPITATVQMATAPELQPLTAMEKWEMERESKFPNWSLLHPMFDAPYYAWYFDWLKANPMPRTNCVCGRPLEPNSRYCAKGC